MTSPKDLPRQESKSSSVAQDADTGYSTADVDNLIKDLARLYAESDGSKKEEDATAVLAAHPADQPPMPIDTASVAATGAETPAMEASPVLREECAYKTYIAQQLQKLPYLGDYVCPVLESRYLQPVTQVADPYVQLGAQKAAPYVEGILSKTSPYVEEAVPIAQRITDKFVQAPAQIVKAVKAAPSQVRQTAVNVVASTLQTVSSMPKRVYQTAADTASSAAQAIKAAPGRTYHMAASTVSSIKAAPGKLFYGASKRTISLGHSVADFAQSFVHRTVGILAPYVDRAAANPRVRDLYDSRVIQGTIKVATPYVQPVLMHPKVEAVSKPVLEWARPRATDESARPS